MTAAVPSGLTQQSWTFERAAALDPDVSPGEIVEGEFVPMSRGTYRHGGIAARIVYLLMRHLEDNPGWFVATNDPGTRLKRNPDTLRGPDVAVLRESRVPTGKGVDGWLDGAPDIAVEIVGDSQTTSELMKKAADYLQAGAQRVWIVDPDKEILLVLSPPAHAQVLGVQILGPTDILDGGDVLPGFRCEVAKLFRP